MKTASPAARDWGLQLSESVSGRWATAARALRRERWSVASELRLQVSTRRTTQAHFSTHEADAHALRHDRTLAAAPQRTRHVKVLPDYIRRAAGVGAEAAAARGGSARPLKRKPRREDDPLRVRRPRAYILAHGRLVGAAW